MGTELHQENKPTVLGRSIHEKCITGGQEWNGLLKSQHKFWSAQNYHETKVNKPQHPRQGVIKKARKFQGNMHFFN